MHDTIKTMSPRFGLADPISVEQKNELSSYPELVQKLLVNRGITDAKSAQEFLNPEYKNLSDPFLLSDMDVATDRILRAIDADEKIYIYSDFDADGIPGGVILHDFFKKIGYTNFDNYIPHRHDEGYGFHAEAVDEMKTTDTKLIITVDVGITAVDQVAHAQKQGIDVIITDHHEPLAKIPDALAVVNPKTSPDYPDPMICGSGVAFQLVRALIQKITETKNPMAEKLEPIGFEKWLLDMAGIATLSDMVPLVKENRIFAYYGMKVLRLTKRPGLVELFRKMKIQQRNLAEEDITFMITPRINAASRMAHPRDAFDVLAGSGQGIHDAVDHLVKLNDKRKLVVAHSMKQAKKKLAHATIDRVLVVGDPDWSAGVLGLIAMKLVEEHNVTTYVWSREGDKIKGSCRSVGDVSVVSMMEALDKDALVQFGGHHGAGGFTATTDQIHFLEEKLRGVYDGVKHESESEIVLETIDAELSMDDVSRTTWGHIAKLAPFGVGNSKPTFQFTDVIIDGVKLFGKEKNHLELSFKKSTGETVRAIAFFKTDADYDMKLEPGEKINLIANIEQSFFMGREEVRLRIVDVG